jgi:hypothetical protein
MSTIRKAIIAAAMIASATTFAVAQGQPTGGNSPVAGGAGGGNTGGATGSGSMMAPSVNGGSVPSATAESKQKDISRPSQTPGRLDSGE